MLHQVSAEVTIECTVRAIPEDIRVSVAEMKVDDVIAMKDLPLPEGAVLVDDGETIVVTVGLVKEEIEAPAPVEVAPVEPEVIGEKKEEEPEEGEPKPKAE